MRITPLLILGLLAALPAAAQNRDGLRVRNPYAELDKIQSNQGCPLSSTSVTVGVNNAFGTASAAQQQLSTTNPATRGCHPLVSTQVVAGANLGLGRGATANQSIAAQGPSGVLGTNLYTRGYNSGYGAFSSANQRLSNQVNR